MTTPTAIMPQPPQQEPSLVTTALGKKGKAHKKASKDKDASTDPTPPNPCALCDVVGHATNTCLELPHLKPMVKEACPESDIPEVYVIIPDSASKLKSLHTNHPCALCDFHGHYTHLCPCLDDFHTSLEVVRKFEVERNESIYPLLVSFASTE